jgi:hypothetical protein
VSQEAAWISQVSRELEVLLLFCFFLAVLEFELRTSCLLCRESYPLNHSASLCVCMCVCVCVCVCDGFFEIGS